MKGADSCLGLVMGVRSGRLGGSLGVSTPVGGSPGLAELTGVIATLIFLGTGADTDLLQMETLELLSIKIGYFRIFRIKFQSAISPIWTRVRW